jgi:hypothetical protein
MVYVGQASACLVFVTRLHRILQFTELFREMDSFGFAVRVPAFIFAAEVKS